MIDRFKNLIVEHHLIKGDIPTLIGVSGGIDSIVLCNLFFKSGLPFAIGHCNFKLRGKESDADEAFVEKISKEWKVDIYTKCFDTKKYAVDHKVSIQEAARDLRYKWFGELKSTHNYGRIATAHHHNDNIETVFQNIIRGTGIRGLRGMKIIDGDIIKPLLFFTRNEIMEYTRENDIEYRDDSSNIESKYERNFIRLNILPLVYQLQPAFDNVMFNNLENWRSVEFLHDSEIRNATRSLCEKRGEDTYIHLKKLFNREYGKTLVFELTRDLGFNFSQIEDILKTTGTGKQIFSASHRILKDRNFLILTPLDSIDNSSQFVEEKDHELTCMGKRINIKYIEGNRLNKSGKSLQLDKNKLVYPLEFRPWKKGDYFYPLGLKKNSGKAGKKKVSDLFIDRKIPRHRKEKAVVVLSAGRICGIIGLEVDERFKVTENTMITCKIEVINDQKVE